MASFGERLRRERELRGVDLRDVADNTKISLRFLQALESDRVDILPGGIFPRAFVKQYASYLGLDAERTVAEFLYAHDGNVAAPVLPPVAQPRRRGAWWMLAAAGLSVGLATGVWLHFRRQRPGPVTQVRPSMVPQTSFPADRVYPPPTTGAAAQEPEDGGLILALSARQSCWVAVDADGVRVMDRIMTEGETQTLNAKSEIVLSVGNAGGIAFHLNGRPGVSLGREGEVRRNIVITRQSLPSLVQEGGTAAPPRSG
jgi:cytoskeleton protein RodZ